jgi:hypothetical protein
MSESESLPPPPSPPPPSTPALIALTHGELLWITLGIWVGGIFILTLLPILLIPRLGSPLGVAGSYAVFFLAWQPVQIVTQRTLGMRSAVLRMLLFVGTAAPLAFYLRELLLTMR